MLVEINKLNQKFEEDHVDITYIETTLDVSISMLCKLSLERIFGVDEVHISSFFVKLERGTLEFADSIGMVHLYPLTFESFPKMEIFGATI